ncbi:MAG: OsmC family protein [Thiothrix sp.]|nr:OsmC family protein [Thiothrix sp.]HPQ96888.1 OsmC family protein [Thiolinea sp.]
MNAKDPHPVEVHLRNETGYTCDMRTGAHELVADEPVPLGGEDLGPAPYQLLKAALGACTAMTLRMYAERKQWPLKDARIILRHSRDANKQSFFERDIRLVGDLSEEQRQRLLEIADRCPVHKTLSSGATILSKLVD